MKLEVITPDQSAYEVWNSRGVNLRFEGKPLEIIPVSSTEELISALQYAIDHKYRLSVRSGGHCLENFVSNPEVDLLIDISAMKGIRFDQENNAIEIKAGATLGEVQETLYKEWGTVLPSGEHPDVGIGGHIPGGAFGFLCRQHGLGVDYLYAVELLWVNKDRKVEKVMATCNEDDQNKELCWAHTGGGAGNFGIVTRYWFRKPGVERRSPDELLPKAPSVIETIELEWLWKDINEEVFRQLLDNFGTWAQQNAKPGMKTCNLYATLHLWNKVLGKIQMKALLTEPTEGIMDDLVQFVNQELGIAYTIIRTKMSWLDFTLNPFPDVFSGPKAAFKVKDAFLCAPFSSKQISTAYHYLTEWDDVPGGNIGLATYGGQVNAVASEVTASAQRKAIMNTACVAGWLNEADAARAMEWVRKCYSDLYQETGGVPVPGIKSGGCIIAHPDNDMADPLINKSGLPWYTFYYQDNYPRLQRIKALWDPGDIFKHALSVKAAD